MRKMLSGFNANTVVIMIVSGLLCYMQKKVLDAVWEIPQLVYKVDQMQLELKREEQERKDADERNRKEVDENKQRIRWVEDAVAKPNKP